MAAPSPRISATKESVLSLMGAGRSEWTEDAPVLAAQLGVGPCLQAERPSFGLLPPCLPDPELVAAGQGQGQGLRDVQAVFEVDVPGRWPAEEDAQGEQQEPWEGRGAWIKGCVARDHNGVCSHKAG